MEEEVEIKPSYVPFMVVSGLLISSALVTNLIVFGFWNTGFPTILPRINLLLMIGIIISCLKIRFNAAIVFTLMVEVLLLVPSMFLVILALTRGKMDVDFFRTFIP